MLLDIDYFKIDAECVLILAKDDEEVPTKKHWYNKPRINYKYKIIVTTRRHFTQTITYPSKEERNKDFEILSNQLKMFHTRLEDKQ